MLQPATPPPRMTTRAALIGGGSGGGDDDGVARRPRERDRLAALERPRLPGGHVHPEGAAAHEDLEAHDGAEERHDAEHPLDAVPPVAGRAVAGERELLGAHQDHDPVAVGAAVERRTQALALPLDRAVARGDDTVEWEGERLRA